MSATVTYKNSTLTTVNNTTKTLKTAGKYMEDDVTITDTVPSIVLTEEHLQPGGGYSIDLTTLGTTPPSIVDTLDANGGTIRTITTDIEVNLQSKNATPSSVQQTITCDSSYDGLSEVLVAAVPSEYIIPTGTKLITENGTGIDVTSYAAVDVNVSGGSGGGIYQSKTINPSEQQQNVTPDSGYDALSSVTVTAIPSDYVGSAIPTRLSADLSVSGANVTVPSGFYGAQVSAAIANGTEGTPIATKGAISNNSIEITPSVTNTAGYISGGTHSGTPITVAANELVAGTLSIDDDGTYDVTNYASAEVDYNIFNHLRYVTFVNNTSKSLTLYALTKLTNGRIANQTVILRSQESTSQYFIVGTSIFEVRSSISDGNYSISYTDSSSSGSVALVAERASSATIWKKIIQFSATFSMADGVITFTDSSDPFPEEVITEPLSVNTNGTYTAPSGTAYTPVTVNVPTTAPSLQTKSISPSETAQTVTPDSGYDGLSQVLVGAISNTYVGSGIDRNDSTDLTASGATVTVPAGYYENSATKTIMSGTEGTPTVTKGTVSNHSVTVTPSVTNTAGYIAGGTKSGTGVNVTASELVSGTKSITDNGTGIDVTNYASVDVSISPKRTATITKAGKHDERGELYSEIRYNGTNYYSLNSTFQFTPGDTATIYIRLYNSGSIIIDIDGNTVVNTTAQSYSYSYTLPDNNINIELENNNASNHIYVMNSAMTPLTVTQNGTYVAPSGTGYTPVTVNVSTPTPSYQSKAATPSETAQTITPDTGYDALSQVSISAVSSTYVGSGITRRSSTDLTASTSTITAPAGYYASAASKTVSAGTAGTPTATKGTVSNHSISITPSVTNTTGWITGSTKSGTAVTVSASELVSGSETKTSNGTYDVTNLASLQVAIPIVTYYTGSSAPSSSLGQNGDIYLQT